MLRHAQGQTLSHLVVIVQAVGCVGALPPPADAGDDARHVVLVLLLLPRRVQARPHPVVALALLGRPDQVSLRRSTERRDFPRLDRSRVAHHRTDCVQVPTGSGLRPAAVGSPGVHVNHQPQPAHSAGTLVGQCKRTSMPSASASSSSPSSLWPPSSLISACATTWVTLRAHRSLLQPRASSNSCQRGVARA